MDVCRVTHGVYIIKDVYRSYNFVYNNNYEALFTIELIPDEQSVLYAL